MHAMSLYGIETWYLKMHKKDLNNNSVVYHMATKRICDRNFYDRKHDCLENARLPTLKHFIATNFVCFAQTQFTSRRRILMIHRHYLRCDSTSEIVFERFFSENYQVIDVFDETLCSMLPQIESVQLTETRSVEYHQS